MLFVTYFELNENTPVEERLAAVRKTASTGLFPSREVNILRWDGTPDGWGILVAEAASAAAIVQAIDVWRAACPGFFKTTKTAPAIPIQEEVASAEGMLKALAAAG